MYRCHLSIWMLSLIFLNGCVDERNYAASASHNDVLETAKAESNIPPKSASLTEPEVSLLPPPLIDKTIYFPNHGYPVGLVLYPGLNIFLPGGGGRSNSMLCGNGERDASEECDDGHESTSCDNDCTLAFCGDGTINEVAGEHCDDGDKGGCTPDCCFPLFEKDMGPTLNLSDDSFQEVLLSFLFPIQGGVGYSSVFVNSNGNVTLGAGSATFSESVAAFLAGPPRLGTLWDDINPAAGGSIHFKSSGNRAVFTWNQIPQFGQNDSNTFQLQLNSLGKVLFTYNGVNLSDGLVGVTPGNNANNPGPINFNPDVPLSPMSLSTNDEPTVYQIFGPMETENFDLDRQSLYFMPHAAGAGWDVSRLNVLFCGDGITQVFIGEECDDTNNISGDGCSAICELERCGDGIIQSGMGEACDDGNTVDNGNGCSANCLANNTCGDGIVENEVEGCDDGSQGSCTPDCCFSLFEMDMGAELNLTDDSFEKVQLGFFFPLQGDVSYSSAFANSNGNVTFGLGSTATGESVAAFLAGPPRLGTLWDDISPAAGGSVHFKSSGNRAVFTWNQIPQFGQNDSNTFQLQLNSLGKVLFTYNGVNLLDGLIGVTPGNGANNPGETNYDTTIPTSPMTFSTGSEPTSYELFDGSPGDSFDLDGQSLYFMPHSVDDGWDISKISP